MINYQKSIERNRAVYDDPLWETVCYVRNIFIAAGIIWLLVDDHLYDGSSSGRFFILFLLLLLSFVIYGTFKRITGYKLERFDTGLGKEGNKGFIRQYFREGSEYGIAIQDDNYLVATRHGFGVFTPTMLSVFLFDGYILLNAQSIDWYGRRYAHLAGLGYLKKELKAALSKYKIQEDNTLHV